MNKSLPEIPEKRVSFTKLSPRRMDESNLIKELVNQQIRTINKPVKRIASVQQYKPSSTHHPLPKLKLKQHMNKNNTSQLVIPEIVILRNEFINYVISLVQQLHTPIDDILTPYIEAKNNYAQKLLKQGYCETFIEQEIEYSILTIMRKLHFSSIHTSIYL